MVLSHTSPLLEMARFSHGHSATLADWVASQGGKPRMRIKHGGQQPPGLNLV
jgi:hypothetical protein